MNAKGSLTLSLTSAAGLPSTALRTKVAMPATTSAAGNAGDYAANGDQLAIYVEGVGWLFFTGFQT